MSLSLTLNRLSFFMVSLEKSFVYKHFGLLRKHCYCSWRMHVKKWLKVIFDPLCCRKKKLFSFSLFFYNNDPWTNVAIFKWRNWKWFAKNSQKIKNIWLVYGHWEWEEQDCVCVGWSLGKTLLYFRLSIISCFVDASTLLNAFCFDSIDFRMAEWFYFQRFYLWCISNAARPNNAQK